MDLKKYVIFYRIDERYMPIMLLLPSACWYVFQSRDQILKTGYYTGTGHNARRVDMTDTITKACVKAGIKFSAYNDAPRGGVTGQKVKIIF